VIELPLAAAALLLSAIPGILYLVNIRIYRPPPVAAGEVPSISLLIPARNEEGAIVGAVEAALASRGVTLEVVVLDDQSEDRTAALVEELARRDPRVRLEKAPPLPTGWCGKQHACHVLAGLARYPLLAFIDADVRLVPDGLARLSAFQQGSGADLVSGFPYQKTGTIFEKMLIPLIHFILLGFLPLARMRRSAHPAYAAGCGQLFLAQREAYEQIGGHASIRTTLHDGIKLPRAFRANGKMTDLCDATDLASCRMYQSAKEVWFGLAKNATEGLATPTMIGPASLLLLGGQVLPVLLLGCGAWLSGPTLVLAGLATLLAYTPRLVGARRFRQSLVGALLHPVGVTILVAIQWYALLRSVVGRPATWKGRSYQRIESA
jgi:hypothetical protein